MILRLSSATRRRVSARSSSKRDQPPGPLEMVAEAFGLDVATGGLGRIRIRPGARIRPTRRLDAGGGSGGTFLTSSSIRGHVGSPARSPIGVRGRQLTRASYRGAAPRSLAGAARSARRADDGRLPLPRRGGAPPRRAALLLGAAALLLGAAIGRFTALPRRQQPRRPPGRTAGVPARLAPGAVPGPGWAGGRRPAR